MTAQDNSGAIPDADLLEAARDLLNQNDACDCAKCVGTTAKVLRGIRAAERQRCAKKADHYTTARMVRRARELTTHEVYEVKIFARLIAAAIRKGDA